MQDLFTFVLSCLLLLIVPGPTNTLLALAGTSASRLQIVQFLAGELAGYLIAVSVIHFLLAPLINVVPMAPMVLKLCFAGFVLWLGWSLLRNGSATKKPLRVVTPTTVFFTTLFNPKAFGFALVLIPFGTDSAPAAMVMFSLVVPAIGLTWMMIGRFAREAGGQKVQAIMSRIAAVLMAGFSAFMVYSAVTQ